MLQKDIELPGEIDWYSELNAAVTVCDRQGIIVFMNKCAIEQFAKYGGEKLVGKNLLECHPEPSKSKLQLMLKEPLENVYITNKNDQRKVIVQKPWWQNGHFRGVVEWSFYLPEDISL
jgi:transcriptional regulator with PAS, ATPase and Fis domain